MSEAPSLLPLLVVTATGTTFGDSARARLNHCNQTRRRRSISPEDKTDDKLQASFGSLPQALPLPC